MLLFHSPCPPHSNFSSSVFILPSLKDSTFCERDLQSLADSHGYLYNGKNKLVTPRNKELVAPKDNGRRQNLIRVQGRMLDPLSLAKECLKHSQFMTLEEELKTDKRD